MPGSLQRTATPIFLPPKFHLLVYTGAVLSALFTLGAALQPPQKSRDQLIRGLVLILPLLFILSAGDATLGSFAMSKRGISSGQPLAPASEPKAPKAKQAPQTAQSSGVPIQTKRPDTEARHPRTRDTVRSTFNDPHPPAHQKLGKI